MRITLNGKNATIEDGGKTIIIDDDSITVKDGGKTKTYKGIEAAQRIADQQDCINDLRAELRLTIQFNEEQARERMDARLRDHGTSRDAARYLLDDLITIAKEATHINYIDEDDEDEWDDEE